MEVDKRKRSALVLPWHGYMSFNFNDNLVMANPARRFFGEKAIVSRSVEVGAVYDQESDLDYLALDKIIRDNGDANAVVDFLITNKVEYVIHFQDLVGTDNLKYDWLKSDRISVVLHSLDLVLYRIGK